MSDHSPTFRASASFLRSGLFARFMVAEFISMVGSWMQTQAQQFEVEKQASSSVEQALISAAMMAVIPLLSPLGGSLADRFDKRQVASALAPRRHGAAHRDYGCIRNAGLLGAAAGARHSGENGGCSSDGSLGFPRRTDHRARTRR